MQRTHAPKNIHEEGASFVICAENSPQKKWFNKTEENCNKTSAILFQKFDEAIVTLKDQNKR